MQLIDFAIAQQEDAAIGFNMTPPTPIGGRNIVFKISKGFGGLSGIYLASVASGFNGASGITITDSGQGRANISLPSLATSGLDPLAYAYSIAALDYPRTVFTEGYCILHPGGA